MHGGARTRREHDADIVLAAQNEEPQVVVPVARLSVTKIHFNPRIRAAVERDSRSLTFHDEAGRML